MLEGIPIVGLTAPTLLGITVMLLLTGRIVPRMTLMDKSKESDQWREAYLAEREARATSDAQTAELLEGLKTNHAVISAMFDTVRVIQESGGKDEAPKG